MGQVSLQAAAGPSSPAAPVALADTHLDTGRPEVPESTLGGETTCIVCFVNPKTHMAVPCSHQCLCAGCAAKMSTCPYCMAPVQLWVQPRVV